MICYRRRGHNEADDPSLTQPLMYNLIDDKRSVRKLYTEALIGRGDITRRGGRGGAARLPGAAREGVPGDPRRSRGRRRAQRGSGEVEREGQQARAAAAVGRRAPPRSTREVVKRVVDSQLTMPEGFTVHPRLAPQLQRRAQMVEHDTIDWAMGETLAFGSLLTEGRPSGSPARTRAAARSASGTSSSSTASPAGSTSRSSALRQRRQALRLRLAAVGVRRDGLRVRLLGRPPRRARPVGGAVRRLRQRRADDRRRVHRVRRAEVGPAVVASRCCSRTATRARGRTTRRPASSASCSCARRTT